MNNFMLLFYAVFVLHHDDFSLNPFMPAEAPTRELQTNLYFYFLLF